VTDRGQAQCSRQSSVCLLPAASSQLCHETLDRALFVFLSATPHWCDTLGGALLVFCLPRQANTVTRLTLPRQWLPPDRGLTRRHLARRNTHATGHGHCRWQEVAGFPTVATWHVAQVVNANGQESNRTAHHGAHDPACGHHHCGCSQAKGWHTARRVPPRLWLPTG
jgi:hypothetical protein